MSAATLWSLQHSARVLAVASLVGFEHTDRLFAIARSRHGDYDKLGRLPSAREVADLTTATEKARRDAPAISVAEV